MVRQQPVEANDAHRQEHYRTDRDHKDNFLEEARRTLERLGTLQNNQPH